jgi:hypothetical protein
MVDSTTGSNNIALGFGAGFNLISGIEAREGSSRHDVSLPEQEHHAAPVEVGLQDWRTAVRIRAY